METTTFDVASSAERLRTALDEGKIADEKLADVVLERLERVRGIKEGVSLEQRDEGNSDIKASSSWTHTWRWPL